MKKIYTTPNMNAAKGALRCSILAGSTNIGNVVQSFNSDPSKTSEVQLAPQRNASLD